MSRSDRPAAVARIICSSARERSSLGAALGGRSPAIFYFFLLQNSVKFHFILFFTLFSINPHLFVARDRRERGFTCILPCFYAIIPGWGGVYPRLTSYLKLSHTFPGPDCNFIRSCTGAELWLFEFRLCTGAEGAYYDSKSLFSRTKKGEPKLSP